MAKKGSKIFLFSVVVVIGLLVVAKVFIFDIVKFSEKIQVTGVKNNSLLIVLKNKTPENSDILLINNPDNSERALVRCIATSGQIIQIEYSQVFIDDKLETPSYKLFYKYRVNCFTDEANANMISKYNFVDSINVLGLYLLDLDTDQYNLLLKDSSIMINKIIIDENLGNESVFPHSYKYRWNEDNFGPISVPKKGMEIELNEQTFSLFRFTINQFEDVEITKDNSGNYIINGEIQTSYIFKNNYYFVLNDYRSDYNDSRKWGFIPQSTIEGVVSTSF